MKFYDDRVSIIPSGRCYFGRCSIALRVSLIFRESYSLQIRSMDREVDDPGLREAKSSVRTLSTSTGSRQKYHAEDRILI